MSENFAETRITAKTIREVMGWGNNKFWRRAKEEGFPTLYKDGRISYCLKSDFENWAKADRERSVK